MRGGETRHERIYSRDGSYFGLTTGGISKCPLGGCSGDRIYIRWPSGRLTYPCSEGMTVRADLQRQLL